MTRALDGCQYSTLQPLVIRHLLSELPLLLSIRPIPRVIDARDLNIEISSHNHVNLNTLANQDVG